MSKTTLIIVILVATLVVSASHASSQPISPTFEYKFCRNEEYGNFTSNSTYEDNLKAVLTDLVGMASTQALYNSSAGSGRATVHGQYYCRGDVSAEFCSQCVLEASASALNCSNARAAIVWFDECTLRYSNESMYGLNYVRPILRSYSLRNLTKPDEFTPVLNETVNGLIQEAAHGNESVTYFATAEKEVSAFATAYFLAQCSPDLSGAQCEACLVKAFNTTRTCCGEWPVFLYSFPQSCQVMYNTLNTFYFTTNGSAPSPSTPVMSPAPPPSVSSEPSTPDQVSVLPTSPPPSTNGGSAAIKSGESMKLGIIAITLVLMMWVMHT